MTLKRDDSERRFLAQFSDAFYLLVKIATQDTVMEMVHAFLWLFS